MKSFIIKMLSEDSGISEGRVQSLMLVIAGIGVAFYGMSKFPPEQIPNITMLATALASLGVGGKLVQKSQELNALGKVTKQAEQTAETGN